MGFPAEEFEVLAAGGILEFFDVCIVAIKGFTLAKDGTPFREKKNKTAEIYYLPGAEAYIRSPN